MLEGYSLRKSAELIGDVHFVTLFYWRHKIVESCLFPINETFHSLRTYQF